jgi:hypothetical protein
VKSTFTKEAFVICPPTKESVKLRTENVGLELKSFENSGGASVGSEREKGIGALADA